MVAKRLGEYFTFKGVPLSNAEKKLSLGNNTLSKAIKENKSIGSSTIEKIISIYSDLNIGWLFSGTGDMLNDSHGNSTSTTTSNLIQESTPLYNTPTTDQAYKSLIERIEELAIEKALMKRELDDLREKIKNESAKPKMVEYTKSR